MKKSLIAGLMAAACTMGASAEQAVTAEELKGRFYGALNYNRFIFDENREKQNPKLPDIGTEYGFGGSVGYRFDENWEARFGYTDIHVQQTTGSTSLDLLYFVNQQSLYFLAGFNYLEVEEDKNSFNAGLGYRHYFDQNWAAFVEGKTYLNPSTSNTDYSAGVGVMYFFGGSGSSEAEESPEAAAPLAAAPAARPSETGKDADRDGVADSSDSCANTPAGNKVDANGCTVYKNEALKFELVVNFAHNSSAVESKYFNEIKRLADFMKQFSQTEVVIAGHTSTPGTEAYNQGLSERRAAAVANVLTSRYGVSSSRIETVGYGETRVRVRGNNEAAHAENRRIEAEVTGTERKAVKR